MPNITIEVKKQYGEQDECRLIDAVHDAVVHSLHTPITDKVIRLIVHPPHRFASPAGTDDRYTLINLDMFPGRSVIAKKSLYKAVIGNLSSFGIPAGQIKIVIHDSESLDNWGIRGGFPASEVDLGFKVDV